MSPSGPHFTDEEAEKETEATCLARIVQADLEWPRGLTLALWLKYHTEPSMQCIIPEI